MDFNYKWMESEAEDIPGFSKQFIMNYKQFQMELQQIYYNSCLDSQCFYVEQRPDCQAVYFDSPWMEPRAGGTGDMSKFSETQNLQNMLKQCHILF